MMTHADSAAPEPESTPEPGADAATERLELHARILASAHHAIHDFAAVQGFTVTALLEEWASSLGEENSNALALIPGARRRTAQARRRRRRKTS